MSSPSYALSFKQSVVKAIPGSNVDSVFILSVTNGSRRRLTLSATTSTSSTVLFSVLAYSANAISSSTLASQLTASVSSGAFQSALNQAGKDNGATALATATVPASSLVIASSTSSSSSSDDDEEYDAMVGLAVVFALLAACVLAYYAWSRYNIVVNRASANANTDKHFGTTANPMEEKAVNKGL